MLLGMYSGDLGFSVSIPNHLVRWQNQTPIVKNRGRERDIYIYIEREREEGEGKRERKRQSVNRFV